MALHWAYLSEVDNTIPASTLAASSTNSAFPAANVKTTPISLTHKFGAKTGDYQIDLGSAKAITGVAIINHNLTAAAVITVNGGSSANPNGSQFTTTMTWRQFDAFVLFATQTWRYWKVLFSDTGNSSNIEVGYLMIGPFTTSTYQFRYGWHQEDDFVNLEQTSVFGIQHIESMYRQTKLMLPFGPLSNAEFTVLRNLYIQNKRNVYGIFILPASTGTDGYFGRFQNQLDRQVDLYSSATLTFLEDSRGQSSS
jgi:hypothetical protein